ncbi:hypothetical protein BW723_16885 [Polaribacter reichenbachii]|uniref:Secretion system C-terminal sorting domain-containing protein n=1 Tax=Polaribacter reichenbachii TaxID=996801 RepID=A0A1B8U5Q0_9FLAO|nr:choice-of-anchor V domain-containing protein [Polaribacter reichenbachii]APZ47865.1 hypothetical protein BW723_16885 [Polaribacter reichenbachii]AUC18499.1 hypothetical protein BTO17_07280 [Polaribacter reichenbachii]OBY67186.1 hypothetical protein LPB301_03370 [Polaribacter reichenbachii]
MKKHYIFKLLLLLIPVSAFLLMSSSGGRSDARSGSPGDGGATCAACHSGGNFNASAIITSNIPTTGYLLNTDYTININTTSSSSAHGFQLTAENNSNAKIGAFTAGSGSRTVNSSKAITHSFPSTSGDWSFTWRSPSTDLGNVTFYTAVNATNGNGNAFDGGDQVITASTSSPSLSISEAKRLKFDLYPNPAIENLNIQLPNGTNKALVQFYNYTGKLVLTNNITELNSKINVSNLSKGIYILKVVSEDKIGSQKFMKY